MTIDDYLFFCLAVCVACVGVAVVVSYIAGQIIKTYDGDDM